MSLCTVLQYRLSIFLTSIILPPEQDIITCVPTFSLIALLPFKRFESSGVERIKKKKNYLEGQLKTVLVQQWNPTCIPTYSSYVPIMREATQECKESIFVDWPGARTIILLHRRLECDCKVQRKYIHFLFLPRSCLIV